MAQTADLTRSRFLALAILLVLTTSLASAQTQWTGLAGTGDWDTAANWSAGVPTFNTDASIGIVAGFQPTISTNLTRECRGLSIASGASLKLGANAVLKIGEDAAGNLHASGNAVVVLTGALLKETS